MALAIPKGYTLDKDIDPKTLGKKKYQPFTVREILEFAEFGDIDLDAPIWIQVYDEENDDLIIRPVEFLSGSSQKDGTGPHIMIG